MTDFGAFIELETGVDALLHVSQISREHVDKPSDVLKVGQIIEAKVVDFNAEENKISLSMKALLPNTPKETPVEDAPVEEVPAEDTPVEEVLETEAPVEAEPETAAETAEEPSAEEAE